MGFNRGKIKMNRLRLPLLSVLALPTAFEANWFGKYGFSISLVKLLKKYSLTPKNKQKVILLSQRKTTNWSGLHRLSRKLEFKQSTEDQNR